MTIIDYDINNLENRTREYKHSVAKSTSESMVLPSLPHPATKPIKVGDLVFVLNGSVLDLLLNAITASPRWFMATVMAIPKMISNHGSVPDNTFDILGAEYDGSKLVLLSSKGEHETHFNQIFLTEEDCRKFDNDVETYLAELRERRNTLDMEQVDRYNMLCKNVTTDNHIVIKENNPWITYATNDVTLKYDPNL